MQQCIKSCGYSGLHPPLEHSRHHSISWSALGGLVEQDANYFPIALARKGALQQSSLWMDQEQSNVCCPIFVLFGLAFCGSSKTIEEPQYANAGTFVVHVPGRMHMLP